MVIFFRANRILANIGGVLAANENTVDTVVDLTQGLARIDIQQEMSTRLHEAHRIMLELGTSPRTDVSIKSSMFRARYFTFRISDDSGFYVNQVVMEFGNGFSKLRCLSSSGFVS